MNYSIVGFLSILVLLVINQEFFRNKYLKTPVNDAYCKFIWSTMAYYIVDIAWGLAYDTGSSSWVYGCTILYYFILALNVVALCQYVRLYLELTSLLGKLINGFGLFFGVAEVLVLIINVFSPIFFSIDDNGNYHAFGLRYIILFAQAFLCVLLVTKTGIATMKSSGGTRRRYRTIFLFFLEMIIVVMFQIAFPLLPLYSIGLLVGHSIIHTFVKEDEKNEYRDKLEKSRDSLAEQLNIVNMLSRDYLNVYQLDPINEKVSILKLDGYVTEIISSEKKEYDYAVLCRKYIEDRVYKDDVDMMLQVMDIQNICSKLEKEEQYVGTYRVSDKGEIHYYQYKYVRIPEADFIIAGFQNVDIMIAAEKENQEKLKEALENANRANVSKTVFLNNMSHDIRTPMNAILGFARLIEKKTDEPEVVLDYINKIEDSGEYLLSIINNVLDMARIESGKIELDEDVVDIVDEGRNIFELFAEDMEKKNLSLEKEYDVQHRYVLADTVRMSQIVVNLISNAVKYTPDGGSIKLTTREMECDKEGYATYTFSVADTGIGMSKQFKEHIFDSFARERTTTESKIIGTGLGMSIVKKLVDLMGGRIEVESEVGKGSTFTVFTDFKIVDSSETGKEEQVTCGEEINIKGKRILLAEDNELNAEIAMEILEEMGLGVEHAIDGVECVDMLLKAEPGYYDMILMDIQMPNLNGYDACKKIRAIEDVEKANIPIVAITANAFEEDRQNALAAGMNDHLAKPIDISALVKTMQKLLK